MSEIINEISYYFAFVVLKQLLERKLLTPEQFSRANVAFAEKYSILPYNIQ